MSKHKTFISILGVVVVVAIALGIIGFFKGVENTRQTGEIPQSVVASFENAMVTRGVENWGQPIEGFDARLLLEAFPGLLESDFGGVESFEGVYTYEAGELKYERVMDQPVTSAEMTVSQEGYGTLLWNLSQRLDLPAQSAEDIEHIVERID